MAQKSVTKRIKIGKTGKVTRRAMSLGHSRGNKTSVQMQRKNKARSLDIKLKTINRYF